MSFFRGLLVILFDQLDSIQLDADQSREYSIRNEAQVDPNQEHSLMTVLEEH